MLVGLVGSDWRQSQGEEFDGVDRSELSSLRFPPGTTVDAVERELILQTLAATNNKTRAAELLGISLKTLHNKLKEYDAAKSDEQ